MSKRSFYVRESELDDFQRQVLNKKVDKSFIVKGCAGSGKSILALWKAHDIVSNNRGSLQIIVFTKALKSYMEEALRAIGALARRLVEPALVADRRHRGPGDPRAGRDVRHVDAQAPRGLRARRGGVPPSVAREECACRAGDERTSRQFESEGDTDGNPQLLRRSVQLAQLRHAQGTSRVLAAARSGAGIRSAADVICR